LGGLKSWFKVRPSEKAPKGGKILGDKILSEGSLPKGGPEYPSLKI